MFFAEGYKLALIEIFIFGISALTLRLCSNLNQINSLVYYWIMFTILTGVWETFFVIHYPTVINLAENLLVNKTHVWTQNYSSHNLNPSNFSQLFYAEYGAYADREYMDKMDIWSRVIESSHSLLCGAFSFLCIINFLLGNMEKYIFCLSVAMGSQLMNSILYMINYCIQVQQPSSVNYNTTSFPSGSYLDKRPFMYINIFWTLMPLIIIFYLLDVLKVRRKYAEGTTYENHNSQEQLPAYSEMSPNEEKKLLTA